MSLKTYKQKRKFNQTPEPEGKVGASSGPPKFVVQKHAATRLHYDFRLEHKGVLLSWAVPKGPSLNKEDKRLAMMVEDHPISYMKFEGIIPEGNYGAGSVIVWDFGNYLALGTTNRRESEKLIAAGLKKGELKVVLNGQKLKGGFALIKLKNDAKGNAWLMIKEKDSYVKKIDVTKQNKSVLSGKTVEQMAKSATKVWRSNRK
ncbi:MAG TPA: DNA polymerase ligase N-terminal domain-containing protein [Verrucomicrobiae bacterium]|nr:DNA polymerase ligase N-terminal domain-containing protein [Verrucomicrobiae bacterium]